MRSEHFSGYGLRIVLVMRHLGIFALIFTVFCHFGAPVRAASTVSCAQLFKMAADSVTAKNSNSDLIEIQNADFKYLKSRSLAELKNGSNLIAFAVTNEKRILYKIFLARAALDDKTKLVRDYEVWQILRDLFIDRSFSANRFNLQSKLGQELVNIIFPMANSYLDSAYMSVGTMTDGPTISNILRFIKSNPTTQGMQVMNKIKAATLNYFLKAVANGVYDETKLRQFNEQIFLKAMGLDYERMFLPVLKSKYSFFLSTDPVPDTVLGLASGEISHYFKYDASDDLQMEFGKNSLQLSNGKNPKTMQVQISRGQAYPTMVQGTHFNTKAMWKSGELTGAIVIGKHLDDKSDLAAEYKAYYKQAGFEFKGHYQKLSFTGYFEKLMADGKLDYILKEDDGIGYVSPKVTVHEGTKKTKFGIERVYIFVSSDYVPEQGGLSLETSNLIRIFNSSPGEALVYIDSTCSRFNCMQTYVQNITRPDFTFIAPKSIAETFTDEAATALRHILDGIRSGSSFDDVRKAINDNKEVTAETSATENDYFLPGDPRFAKEIPPLYRYRSTIKVRFLNSNGSVIDQSELFNEK